MFIRFLLYSKDQQKKLPHPAEAAGSADFADSAGTAGSSTTAAAAELRRRRLSLRFLL